MGNRKRKWEMGKDSPLSTIKQKLHLILTQGWNQKRLSQCVSVSATLQTKSRNQMVTAAAAPAWCVLAEMGDGWRSSWICGSGPMVTSRSCRRTGAGGWYRVGGTASVWPQAKKEKIPMQLASLFSVSMYPDKFEHIENTLCHGMEWILNAPIGSLCNILNTC